MRTSTARPPDVHIDDLAHPHFSAEIDALRAQVGALADTVALEPGAIKEAASSETGLDDFGDPWFEEPLEMLCRALRDEAGLGPAGVVTTYFLLVGVLKNRLLVEDVVRRHPAVEHLPVSRPIIICGLPRTGTTHLHNLMAADPALRHLPYWESLEPVLAEAERPAPGESDPRLARTAQGLDMVHGVMPLFDRMHEMTVTHAHEEIQLLAIAGSTMLFETTALMPSWRAWYLSTDQTPAYRYLRRILQVLQWERGGERWVLKSPQHSEQFGPLRATFPDATFVVTHRDPVAVTASMTTMLTYSARMAVADIDPHAYGRYWSDRLEGMLHRCVDDRELLPAERSVDIRFGEFMAHDIATVERVYELADQPFTASTRASMEAFMAAHPRGRHGRVTYDLADFGLDWNERRGALRFYTERFAIAEEAPGAG
ncbi:MAG: sulfotransferase family protein [Acidimicrobiales bacterium]